MWGVRMPFLALGRLTPTTCLRPEIGGSGWLAAAMGVGGLSLEDDGVFGTPLPPRALGRLSHSLAWLSVRSLAQACPGAGTVVFTRPDQRAFVRHFQRARRIYFAADDYSWEYGWPAELVHGWEREILAGVDHVFCLSEALARVFTERYGWPRERTLVAPMGFPAARIPSHCPRSPCALPAALELTRPVAGVLGSLSRRTRLDWLRVLVDSTPWLSWLFVGPAQELPDSEGSDLEWLRRNPRCRFLGPRPYAELLEYNALIDVTVIPFAEGGHNRACSLTRLFGHLPFGQPVLASRGCDQIEEFEPLARIFDSAEEMVAALEALRRVEFDDGRREARWGAARDNTWERRAEEMLARLARLESAESLDSPIRR